MASEGETLDWLFEAARWWVANFGGYDQLASTTVLLPIDEHFPVHPGLGPDELARDLFEFAQHHAGLAEWPLVLDYDERGDVKHALKGVPHHMTSAPLPAEPHEEAPLIAEGDPLPIPVHPDAAADATVLLATVARGMAHYLLPSAAAPPPGDAADRELYVDFGAVMLGFGVFCANASFRFNQFTEGLMVGWGYSRHGALSQKELSYALALSAVVSNTKNRPIMRHLEANPRADFKRGRKLIEKKRKKELEALRAVAAAGEGPYRTATRR